jgi:hypothetical protein
MGQFMSRTLISESFLVLLENKDHRITTLHLHLVPFKLEAFQGPRFHSLLETIEDCTIDIECAAHDDDWNEYNEMEPQNVGGCTGYEQLLQETPFLFFRAYEVDEEAKDHRATLWNLESGRGNES